MHVDDMTPDERLEYRLSQLAELCELVEADDISAATDRIGAMCLTARTELLGLAVDVLVQTLSGDHDDE